MRKLTAALSLDGYARDFDGVALAETSDVALVSVAIPLGGRDTLTNAMTRAFGIALPDVGSTGYSKDGKARCLGLQRDLMFLMIDYDDNNAVGMVREMLGDAGFYTDQTDSWAMLRMTGPGCRAALQRICMLDLDPHVFAVGAVSRTTMEHLGVIILRDAEDSFLLFSPRSSAKSFLYSVETSIINTT